MTSQNETNSTPVWKAKNAFTQSMNLAPFGGVAGMLTWDEQSKTIRFVDTTNTTLQTIDVQRVTKYLFRLSGNYTIWVDTVPFYFNIRYISLTKRASKVAHIADGLLENSFTTYSDRNSAIRELKKFINTNNPSAVGAAPANTATITLLLIAAIAGFIIFGVLVALF
jgi:hypothetical protein